MSKIHIAAPAGYEIIRHGNGLAYELICSLDFASVFLQGDDALDFERNYEAACIVGQEAMRSVVSGYDEIMSHAS